MLNNNTSQSQCSDVLQDLRNNLVTSNTTTSKEVYKRYFYHLTEKEAYAEYSKTHDSSNDTSGMFEVTIPIDDVPVTPKGSGAHGEKLSESEFSERFESWKESVRDQIESEKYYDEHNYYEKSEINPGSITAWENCMSSGFFAYASRSNDDTVMIKVFYKTPSILFVRLEFVTPHGINVEIGKNNKIHGSKVYKVTGNVKDAFSISVNGDVIDSEGNVVENIAAFDIEVGPAVLPRLPETPRVIKEDDHTEVIAIVDGGLGYETIGDAETRRHSWVNGGSNPKVGVNYRDYRIVKLPDGKYYVSIGFHLAETKTIEIIDKWWWYDSRTETFQMLYLEINTPKSSWTQKNQDGIDYFEYSGRIKKQEILR
jgi:hypothetical protein